MNKIQPTYVSFEQAKLLKEKGFIEYCNAVYDNHDKTIIENHSKENYNNWNDDKYVIVISAPEQWQIVEWLRVNHGIWVKVDHFMTTENTIDWDFEVDRVDTDVDERGNYVPLYSFSTERSFTSPQEAYSAAFDYILKELI